MTVIDNNILRNEAEIRFRIDRFRQAGEQIALPEIALFEMTKHPTAWPDTTRRSLQLIAQCPDALVMTHSTKRMGLAEENTGEPTRSVISEQSTARVRAILRDISAGSGDEIDALFRAVAFYRDEMDYEGHARNSHDMLSRLAKLAEPSLHPKYVNQISKELAASDRSSFRRLLVQALPASQHRDAMVRRSVPFWIAQRLTDVPSVSTLFAMAVGAIAFEWTIRRGVATARPERVGNDIIDIEYAIAGIWIGGFVSNDTKSRARYQDLQVLGSAIWPDHASWLMRADAIEPR
ncbi:hypothetical protein [Sorangium sp. So ce1099]|uniref:hypothetical protein n=1 Tax=Sorangium sp. So ce1099 TaxID=3133331 RepID=UPI003F63B4D8